MPLCEITSQRPYNRPRMIKRDTMAAKRRTKHRVDENQALSEPHNQRVLSKCTWQFYHEPDQDNFGPQLIVTEPNGNSHYLVDQQTFMRKLQWYSARYMEEGRGMIPTEGVFEALVLEENGDDDHDIEEQIYAATAQATLTASARWKMRLRGGIMQRWKKRNSSSILPLYHTHEMSSTTSRSGVSEKTDQTNLLDFSRFWGNQQPGSEPQEAPSITNLFGALGILRTIAHSSP